MAETKVAPGLTSEVVNGRTIYKNAKGERVKADGSPYAKRGEGGGAPKRPAYIVYKSITDGAGAHTGDFEIVNVSRSAEEVLKAVEADRNLKYKRTEI